MVKMATIRAAAQLQMGCAPARSGVVRVGTLGLHYLEWGSADHPPLLFLHGGSAHAHWFDAVAPAFAARYHVVSLDQRGHGESEWARPATYATEDFAGDLLAVFDALSWRQAIVVGHSMGGHNAMAFSGWHSERVRGLVVLGRVRGRPGPFTLAVAPLVEGHDVEAVSEGRRDGVEPVG